MVDLGTGNNNKVIYFNKKNEASKKEASKKNLEKFRGCQSYFRQIIKMLKI